MKTVDWLRPVEILSAFGPEGKPSLMENTSMSSARKSSWISIATGSVELSASNVTSTAVALKSSSPAKMDIA
jgi:hypothetical protein